MAFWALATAAALRLVSSSVVEVEVLEVGDLTRDRPGGLVRYRACSAASASVATLSLAATSGLIGAALDLVGLDLLSDKVQSTARSGRSGS